MSVTFTLPKNINFDQVEPSPTSRSFVDARFVAVADLVDQAKAEFDASIDAMNQSLSPIVVNELDIAGITVPDLGGDIPSFSSVEDCGVLVDGGDIYYNGEWTTKFKSLDDTFSHTTAGPDELINIAYLDNRKTYSKDPDKGLLFAIQDILSKAWLFKFTHKDGQTIGKMEDVTSIIAAKLAEKELGMQDVLLVGMI